LLLKLPFQVIDGVIQVIIGQVFLPALVGILQLYYSIPLKMRTIFALPAAKFTCHLQGLCHLRLACPSSFVAFCNVAARKVFY